MGKPFTHSPASDTAAVVTVPAQHGVHNEINSLVFSYDRDPAAGAKLTIESPAGTEIWRTYVTAKGCGPILFGEGEASCKSPTRNAAIIVTLSAGGTGVSGSVSLLTPN